MARNGQLLNSLPCYEASDRMFMTNRYTGYRNIAQKPYYNLRENVRYDRNWGRSAWSVPSVQRGYPYNIVDANHDWQGSGLIEEGFPYSYTFYDARHVTHYDAPVNQECNTDSSYTLLNRMPY